MSSHEAEVCGGSRVQPIMESVEPAAGGDGQPPTAARSAAADDDESAPDAEHDPHFEPVVSLPLTPVPDTEADEEELLALRAKLFRMDRSGDAPEWKERGTGTVRILQHKFKPRTRVLMRRDKTLKVCANHFVMPNMVLRSNCGSDRAWVWSVLCDFADEELKPEMLAIRFANADNAKRFKEVFTEAQEAISAAERCGAPSARPSVAAAGSTDPGTLSDLSVQADPSTATPVQQTSDASEQQPEEEEQNQVTQGLAALAVTDRPLSADADS